MSNAEISRFGQARGWGADPGNSPSKSSSGVSEPGGDAVNGAGYRSVDLGCVFAGAFAAEQVDLDEAHGIDVGIAQADGAGKHSIPLE